MKIILQAWTERRLSALGGRKGGDVVRKQTGQREDGENQAKADKDRAEPGHGSALSGLDIERMSRGSAGVTCHCDGKTSSQCVPNTNRDCWW